MTAYSKPPRSLDPTSIPSCQRRNLIDDPVHSCTISKEVPFPSGTLTDMVMRCATENRSRSAVRGPRKSDRSYGQVNYAQLVQHAYVIAQAIVSPEGKNSSDPPGVDEFVGILLPRNIEFVAAALGVLMTGAAYMPMYESLPDQRMQWYLEDSEAKVVITNKALGPRLSTLFKGDIIYIEDLQEQFYVSAARAAKEPLPDLTKLHEGRLQPQQINSRNLAYIIYTSGTTGRPKGVQVEHRGVVNMLHHHANVLVDQNDVNRSVLVAALIFDSSIRETWLPLVTGGCLCIAENVMDMTEGTMCAGTPSGLTVATLPESLDTVMVGGERLTEGCIDNINTHHPKKIINAYGPTETTVECLMHYTDTSETKRNEVSWIGLPIWNVHLYGVTQGAEPDPTTGKFPLAKRGEPCELFVGGVGVARGYRNDPAKTSAKFLPNPFGQKGMVYRTGDLVRWTEGGDLEYLGRTDNQIKLRGFRIELEEVERVCSESKGVAAAAVVIKKDRRGQEQLVAYVTPIEKPEDQQNETEGPKQGDLPEQPQERAQPVRLPPHRMIINSVLSNAGNNMAEYMVPAEVVVLPSLPFTIGGKVDKRALPEPDWGMTKRRREGRSSIRTSLRASVRAALLSDDASTNDIAKAVNEVKKQESLSESDSQTDSLSDVMPPSNKTETAVVEALGEILGSDACRLSVSDNMFTDFGLTSIDAALLRRKLLEKGFEIDGTATILRHPTPRALANHMLGASNDLEQSILATICDMLDVATTTVSVTDNFFTDYGLSSIDAALLRRKLTEKGIEVDGTASILKHGTVRELAAHIKGERRDGTKGDSLKPNAKKLRRVDVKSATPMDEPLPTWLVWIITLVGFVLAAVLTYMVPVILWIIELSLVHRWGSCGWQAPTCNADEYRPWNGFFYNAVFTPFVLITLFFVELFIVWAVKWTVVGRYRIGAYSVNGGMYLRWWFVHTFMTFTYFFLLGPLRCTGLLNAWYRALGAKIGKNVVLDSVAIYEPDLIEIGDNVTIQSDASVMAHVISRDVVKK